MMEFIKSIALLALAALTSVPLSANDHTDPIMVLEQQWVDALIANDMFSVGQLMHRDFRLVRSYGDAKPLTKERYLGLEGMSASSAKLVPYSVSYHDRVATVVMDYTIDWRGPQGPLPPRFLIVDTWVMTDAGWKIIQRVSTLKP